MEEILIGTTDRTITVFIPDPASTDGSGKTGLVAADLTVSFIRVETDNDVTVTDATGSLSNLSALTDAHTDWGLKEVSSSLAPGEYRLDLADAVFATGAWYATVYVMITTSAASAVPVPFKLVNFDLFGQSASDLKDFADTGYDPSTHKVQGVVLTDTTTALTNLPLKKNTAFSNYCFAMKRINGAIGSGLTVSAQRIIDGGAIADCDNAVAEVSDGVYKINLTAADLNGNNIVFIFTASSARQLEEKVVTHL